MEYDFIQDHLLTYSGNKLEIVKQKGITITDEKGNDYLNLNDIAIVLGYDHEKFNQRISENLLKYPLAHLGNVGKQKELMIQRFMEYTHHHFDKISIAGSGGEVVDWSIKIARRKTQKDRIISFNGALHGRSFAGAYISGLPSRKTNFGTGLENVSFWNYPEASQEDSLAECIYDDIACIIIEPIQAVTGMKTPNKKWWKWLREYTKANNIVLIFDEIQTGFGKTGTLFYYEQTGIIPDLLLVGKGMSNGFGLGAILGTREVTDCLKLELAGGSADNEFMCSVVNTVFDLYEEEKILEHVKKMGDLFINRFNAFKKPHWKVDGAGLFMSFVMDEDLVDHLHAYCRHHGILLGKAKGRLVIRSPLVIQEKEVNQVMDVIEEGIKEYS